MFTFLSLTYVYLLRYDFPPVAIFRDIFKNRVADFFDYLSEKVCLRLIVIGSM